MQAEHECLFCVVDLHAITVAQSPESFRACIRDTMALYIACGLDYKKHCLFIQSHVPEHSELAWILQCSASLGQLQRMTQFKDKANQHSKAINAGLLTYPTLMAADILLYDTELVPVGDDQKQHLEFARDLAESFNHNFGQTFVMPNPVIATQGSRVMSLQDPSKKMSKSDPNQNAWVALLDSPALITKKIKRAVTDSEAVVALDPLRPGISNLLGLYSCFTGMSAQAITEQYAGQGYGIFKADLAELVVSEFEPIQKRYQELLSAPEILDEVIEAGAKSASQQANKVLARVKNNMGFI